MDSKGFKKYIIGLGGMQRSYLQDIPLLERLEEKYKVDLDDYVPYDEDYDIVRTLDSLMSEDDRFNERLGFAINKYMNYRLETEESCKGYELEFADSSREPSTILGLIKEDYICFSGTGEDLKKQLSLIMPHEDADKVIDNLLLIKGAGIIKDDSEFIRTEFNYNYEESEIGEHPNDIVLHDLIGTPYYNIRVGALTLIAVAVMLDIHLTLGFASAALMILGLDGKAVVKVETFNGEVCLIQEALQNKIHMIDENVLNSFNHECVHNDLECRYRVDDKCTIKKSEIKSTLDDMCQNNIFSKIGSMYKYNF